MKSTTDVFDKLIKNSEAICGANELLLSELFDDQFMLKHSKFSNWNEFIIASGYKIDSKEDFERIPDAEWDDFINKNTSFISWITMQKTAVEDWAKKKMDH